MLILQFILAIASLILIHEIGHFVAAKIVGIEISEFGIGFPPRLFKLFEYRGTEYTLNWIPLGGFVRPKGMLDPDEPGGLGAAKPLKRIFFYLAGSAMNFLAGFVMFSILFFRLGEPIPDQILITKVAPGSPAESAGIQAGDYILSINGEPLDSTYELIDITQENVGDEIDVVFSRNDTENTVTLIPRVDPPENEGAMGIQMTNPYFPIPWGRALSLGAQVLINYPSMLLNVMRTDNFRLSGYKGIYDAYEYNIELDAEAGREEPKGINTLGFLANISISLGLINLFPIPAFDGGRILFTLPEIIFRKKIPAKYENMLNAIGFAFLLIMLLIVNINDFTDPLNFK